MNVTIIAVDKLREQYLRTGCALYAERLAPYCGITVLETRKGTGPEAVAREGREIIDRIHQEDVVWALDRSGESLSSIEIAHKVSEVERAGRRRLVCVIGGPQGLDKSVLARADFCWSLSGLTFLHEMSRLIVLEQLYRAAKIVRGEPYHR